MDATTALIDALRTALPAVDAVALAAAIQALVRGERATIGGNTASLTLGQNTTISNATLEIGDVVGGDKIVVTVPLPQPLDPLPAALATFASIPLDHLPPPTTLLPPTSRMPFARNGQFVGRDHDLMTLATVIADPAPTVMVSAVAVGLGGIGKTSLAVEFVYRYARYFAGGVFWLNCADPATIAGEIAACAGVLGLAVAGLALDEQVAAVRRAWEGDMPRLLVFDNCEDPALLEQWRPPHGGSRVLVTARRGNWPRDLHRVALGVLNRADSGALLRRLCPRLTVDEAEGLAADLGDLPLALHLAGSYLETYDHLPVETYRTQISLDHPSLQGRGTEALPTRHERDVARTFARSYDHLDATNPIDEVARWLLACAASLAPGVPIPRDLLLAMVPAGTTPEDAIDALNRLRAVGLLDGAVPVLHRLLAGFVQRHHPTDAAPVAAVVAPVLAAAADAITAAGRPTAMAALMPHLLAAVALSMGRVDSASAQLLTSLGCHLHAAGDYAQARPHLERALRLWEAVVGPAHLTIATSLTYLAEVLYEQGDIAGAQPYLERAFQIREAVVGPTHPVMAVSLNDLAGLLYALGQVARAEPLFRRALAIREAALGPDHPDTAMSLNNLAEALRGMGALAAAAPLYERALAIREATLGPAHPLTAGSVNNLAGLYYALEDDATAVPLFRRALAIREATLGPDHPDTAQSLSNLAVAVARTGHPATAVPLLARALTIWEAVVGPDHPRTQRTQQHLAACRAARDQAELAGERQGPPAPVAERRNTDSPG